MWDYKKDTKCDTCIINIREIYRLIEQSEAMMAAANNIGQIKCITVGTDNMKAIYDCSWTE